MQITTSDRARAAQWQHAHALSERHGFELVRRSDADWSSPVLVVTRSGLSVRADGTSHRWHPGMLHALRASGPDHPLIWMTDLRPGHTVVDCTLGLGTDAIFLSEWTGTTVVAFEVDPVVGELTREGLAGVGASVEVRLQDAVDGLAGMPDDSVDLVLADPMFPDDADRRQHSFTLDGVRAVTEAERLGRAWRDQALRVARHAVLLRDVRGGDLLETLEVPHWYGRSGRIARYGVWRLDGQVPARLAAMTARGR